MTLQIFSRLPISCIFAVVVIGRSISRNVSTDVSLEQVGFSLFACMVLYRSLFSHWVIIVSKV